MPEDKGEKVEKKKVRKKIESPFAWKRKWIAEGTIPVQEVRDLSSSYMDHLRKASTEREAVKYWEQRLSAAGFKDLEHSRKLSPGEGFYLVNRGKGIVLGITGKKDLTEGANIIVSHLDSPRLDLKPNPLTGDGTTGLGMLRTHYYGGIKKYHWVNIPLCLKGRIVTEEGKCIDISVGSDPKDPVFIIPDLEPHLSKKVQDKRKLNDGILGEELQALSISGMTFEEGEEDPVSEQVLKILHERYGIRGEDLISSELCLVPAWGPKEIGLDRGLIGSYGHDNRVSSFSANEALARMKKEHITPDRWCISFCFDKEEIGSDGQSGAKSAFIEISLYKMLVLSGGKGTGKELRKLMSSSFALSADVKSGINPGFKSVQEPFNAARLGAGLTITKYTGRGGKIGANDASAEMVSSIRRIYNKEGIIWQMQETGRVDAGGGGTVAKFMACRNMDVLDTGIPLLSMHSPFEVLAKTDLYMAVKGFTAFFKEHPIA